MYIKCHRCQKSIHHINIVISPEQTMETNILSLTGIKLEDLWGANIKCECGHSHSGPILDSPKGIYVDKAEYEVIR